MTIDVYMPLQKYSCKKKKTNEFEKHGHNSSVLAKGSNTFVIVITTDLFWFYAQIPYQYIVIDHHPLHVVCGAMD